MIKSNELKKRFSFAHWIGRKNFISSEVWTVALGSWFLLFLLNGARLDSKSRGKTSRDKFMKFHYSATVNLFRLIYWKVIFIMFQWALKLSQTSSLEIIPRCYRESFNCQLSFQLLNNYLPTFRNYSWVHFWRCWSSLYWLNTRINLSVWRVLFTSQAFHSFKYFVQLLMLFLERNKSMTFLTNPS